MDILLSGFVKKNIDKFDETQLNELDKFLDLKDDVILNYYHHGIVEEDIDKNKISKIFKDHLF